MLASSHGSAPQGLTQTATPQLETIASLSVLESLRAEWTSLWGRARDATPFQSPAWILSWASHFAPDRTGAIAVRDAQGLVALVPFFIWKRVLLLAGTGPTDYCDGLFVPGAGESSAAQILNALETVAAERGLTGIDLQQLRPGSPLLHAPAPPGCSSEISAGSVCPVTLLSKHDGIGVSTARLRKLRRMYRLLQVRGECQLGPAAPDEIALAAETLAHLHGQRWAQRGESGVLADSLMHAFIRTALPALNAARLLHVERLRVGKHTVAIVFALQSRDAAYCYLGGFDPEWSRFSPGALTVVATMERVAAEGAREFHFLRGREGYKYHLGAHDRPTFRRVLKSSA
ncbi:MAG: glycosyl transferase, group 1 [Gammaproteobacteria bacterium]|jgi:CelD/BcsL family acetyltransferase involved in cellulose biosynthesis|nr:glycosyl transferase, group 1 [Gammaproteobacteria bacterium]